MAQERREGGEGGAEREGAVVSAMDRSTRGDDAEERRLVAAGDVAAGSSERVENPRRQIPVENSGEDALLGEEGDVLRG